MELKAYFRRLADYHVWATRRLLASNLAGLSDEQWHRDAGLFFRSVHGTANHLLVTDHIWYGRFAEQRSLRLPLDAELHADRAELCEALSVAVERWGRWIDMLEPSHFDGILAYQRTQGAPVEVPFAPTLGHVFNHATHHRGQLSAALTAMGLPGPELDWVYQLREAAAAR
ncbi:DinB family protein [Dyella sedimenti]|uniref:DinB family protein n=1 Tax=Dyella sedimenti TaxID=2919947 RepID=UPI001FA995D1|nr:DinB family protein [Dyella sedimenti]